SGGAFGTSAATSFGRRVRLDPTGNQWTANTLHSSSPDAREDDCLFVHSLLGRLRRGFRTHLVRWRYVRRQLRRNAAPGSSSIRRGWHGSCFRSSCPGANCYHADGHRNDRRLSPAHSCGPGGIDQLRVAGLAFLTLQVSQLVRGTGANPGGFPVSLPGAHPARTQPPGQERHPQDGQDWSSGPVAPTAIKDPVRFARATPAYDECSTPEQLLRRKYDTFTLPALQGV